MKVQKIAYKYIGTRNTPQSRSNQTEATNETEMKKKVKNRGISLCN